MPGGRHSVGKCLTSGSQLHYGTITSSSTHMSNARGQIGTAGNDLCITTILLLQGTF